MSKRLREEFLAQQDLDYEKFCAKNDDYGNSFAKQGLVGILCRIQDKINRGMEIDETTAKITDEKLYDTINDLGIYCTLYSLCDRDRSLLKEMMDEK